MVVVTAGSAGPQKVLLISGKQSGLSPVGYSRPISVLLPPASPASSDSDSNNSSAGPPVRKRQRLTHLSTEEKALRRLVSLINPLVNIIHWGENQLLFKELPRGDTPKDNSPIYTI